MSTMGRLLTGKVASLVIMSSVCFTLCTYNCQGHGPGRLAYVKQLTQVFDFVLIQEHWDRCKETQLKDGVIENKIPNT